MFCIGCNEDYDEGDEDIREMDASDEMTTDIGKWKRTACCADPK
jgi:hypothetical protein